MLLFSSKLHKSCQRKKTLGMPVKFNNFKSLFCMSPHLATGGNSNFLSTSFKQLLVSLDTNFGKDIPNQEKLKGASGRGGGGWFAFPSYMTL